MKVIINAEQVIKNIARLTDELRRHPALADRLGFVHAWYIDTRDREDPKFGFSKFVGYQDLDAATYLRNYKELNGRNTEWVLKDFFDVLRPGSPEWTHYYAKLSDWLGGFGKTPRKSVRLMVLKPELVEVSTMEDRRLLNLLVAVADLLPLEQRHELRARL